MPTSSLPTTRPWSPAPATALASVSGGCMAIYLLLRPYGDTDGGDTPAAAEAFASPLWVFSHLAGAAALVALAALWAQVATGWPRWTALLGVALVLPYYGVETFALHEIGARALSGGGDDPALVAAVRDNPVAMTLFGIGLLALAAAGFGAALAWRRTVSAPRTGGALVPLAVIAGLFLPQFFLPPVGRMAYGLAFAAAGAYAAYRVRTMSAREAAPSG